MFELDGKVAIVTGASRGIGGAISVGLACAGADVLLVSRSQPRPDVIAEMEKSGRKFAHFAADLSLMSNIKPTVEAALTQFGRIDILVNNAGIILRNPFLDYTEADWDTVNNINLKVPVFLAQASAPPMAPQGSGG